MEINIHINGTKVQAKSDLSVSDILKQRHFIAEKIAVAVNKKFVPRSNYHKHIILENDVIDIVAPIQGG